MLRFYDPYTKEYVLEATSNLETFGYITFFALLLLATAAFFFVRIKFIGGEYEFAEFSVSEHQATTFTSALFGFVFLAVGIFLSLSLISMLMPTQYVIYQYSQLASYILLFFVAAYFIVSAMEAPHMAKAKRILAFFLPLWSVAFALTTYTNPLYLYSDFNRMLCTASIGALTFFFLYEAKASALKKTTPAYFVFSLIATTLCLAYIIPNFILFAYWELTSELHFLFEIVELGAICYIPSVSFTLVSTLKKRELPEAVQDGEYQFPEET